MSFMYNPFPYDDPRAVNRPALPKKTVGAVVAGTSKAAAALAGEIASRLKAAPGKNVVVGVRRLRHGRLDADGQPALAAAAG